MEAKRSLINARLKNLSVTQNDLYAFSLKHTLSIYPINAVCTFIPKNACSTLRYSVAVANGFLSDIADIEWIHTNNETFTASQREIARAQLTFVILRCPFTRAASCFLNKFVDNKLKFNDANGNKLSVNFNEFLLIVKSQNRKNRNIHWRNQSDFLHYEQYDKYFALESFSEAADFLSEYNFKIHDTRSAINHDLSIYKKSQGDYSKTKDIKLKEMKDKGVVPSYKSMFGETEIRLVKEIYADDISLYKKNFGSSELLF